MIKLAEPDFALLSSGQAENISKVNKQMLESTGILDALVAKADLELKVRDMGPADKEFWSPRIKVLGSVIEEVMKLRAYLSTSSDHIMRECMDKNKVIGEYKTLLSQYDDLAEKFFNSVKHND